MQKVSRELVHEDFERRGALPQFFFRRADRALIEVHMDDFHGCAEQKVAEKVVARLQGIFDIKATEGFCEGCYSHRRRGRLRVGINRPAWKCMPY